MARFIYTAEQLEFLRAGYQTMLVPELARAFNRQFGMEQTAGMIKSTLKNHGITCGRAKGKGTWASRLFTPEQDRFLRDNYPLLTLPELTAALNSRFGTVKTKFQVRVYLHNHQIICGRTGCFEKGLTPWNKGIKGYIGANATSFKKGQIPSNYKPLGFERVTRDGYIEIKIAETNPYTGFPERFRQKHVHVWEQAHGPVPKGHVVVFRDGDKFNCAPENLMCVHRNELLLLNLHKYWEQPEELKPSVLALIKLEAKAGIRTTGKQPGAGRKKKNISALVARPESRRPVVTVHESEAIDPAINSIFQLVQKRLQRGKPPPSPRRQRAL